MDERACEAAVSMVGVSPRGVNFSTAVILSPQGTPTMDERACEAVASVVGVSPRGVNFSTAVILSAAKDLRVGGRDPSLRSG